MMKNRTCLEMRRDRRLVPMAAVISGMNIRAVSRYSFIDLTSKARGATRFYQAACPAPQGWGAIG